MNDKKFYLVIRPSCKPNYYYTFAESTDHAIRKVTFKHGDYDPKAKAKELNDEELNKLVIATDYFG